jgi:5'-deoxynucleotidase YfbR-like HD superfamily hydrolase
MNQAIKHTLLNLTFFLDTVKEFLKQNKKNRILKLNDQIENMFNKCQYQDIIDQVEEFAEYHKMVSILFVQLSKIFS